MYVCTLDKYTMYSLPVRQRDNGTTGLFERSISQRIRYHTNKAAVLHTLKSKQTHHN